MPPLGLSKYKLLFDDACIQCFAPADPYICITPSSKFPVSNDPNTNDGFEAVGVVKLDKPYLICVLELIVAWFVEVHKSITDDAVDPFIESVESIAGDIVETVLPNGIFVVPIVIELLNNLAFVMAAFPIVKPPEDKEASPDNVIQLLVVPVDCKNWLAVPEVNLDNAILLAFKIAVILPAEWNQFLYYQ